MYADVDYEVAYTVRIGAGLRRSIVKQDNVHLPHTNIHSCFPTAGACTPFVQNNPGLSTHTDEQESNLDADGIARFASVINLPENRYTIIAHARFFVPSASCSAGATSFDCLDKIDMAIGEQRKLRKATSLPPPPPPTTTLFPSGGPSRCYLDASSGGREDPDTLCPVCWETPTNSPSIKAKIVHCPPGFELEWIKAPPRRFFQDEDYDVSYRVKIGNRLDQLEAVQGFDIAHSNVHSCFASVEECTPSIADTPGLATHTDAEKSNVNRRGEAEFTSEISQLPPGEYTVIAHVRFFLGPQGNIWTTESSRRSRNGGVREGLMQYDAAIGLRRTVRPTRPDAPDDADFIFG